MDRLTHSENIPKTSISDKDDPFGDSFTSVQAYNLLPPPESSKRHQKPKLPEEQHESLAELAEVLSKVHAPLATTDTWLQADMHESVSFGEDMAAKITESGALDASGPASASSDVFTELDPLGTGKIKPYVDKKYFFQDLKNPPKKILRELSGGNDNIQFDANFANRDQKLTLTDIQRLESDSLMGGGSQSNNNGSVFDPFKEVNIDLFADDPFASDPFEDNSLGNIPSERQPTPNPADIVINKPREEKQPSPNAFINGPLQVNLPPENWISSDGGAEGRKTSESPQPSNIARNRPTAIRQNTMDAISSLNSKKIMKPPTIFPHSKFGKRDSNSITMRRLQESDSMSENELPLSKQQKQESTDYNLINVRPEPPPRPEAGCYSK